MIPQPPKLEDLLSGTKLVAGMGVSTILADFDFETYSEAGFLWDEENEKFVKPPNMSDKGLPGVGAAVYSEHPTCEVLSMAYDLKDGIGKRLWMPGLPNPQDLFDHLARGGLLEAWNCAFERWIWTNVCVRKYGWPALPFDQLRDAMAKSRASAYPGSLDPAGLVLDIKNKKDKEGKRLIQKFSIPRTPTKNDPRKRIRPCDDAPDAALLYRYNLRDIEAEAEISSLVSDLTEHEQEFWLCDQRINFRGVQLDQQTILNGIAIVEQAHEKYNDELFALTYGHVTAASEIAKLSTWITNQGLRVGSLAMDAVEQMVKNQLTPPHIRRVLEIRQILGSAAVKKLYALRNQSTTAGRVHDLFAYHSARTGRHAGQGPQPQNLPNSGPDVSRCMRCKRHFGKHLYTCLWCGAYSTRDIVEWNPQAVEDAIETINTRNLQCVEYYWGNAIDVISGCLRGLFIAKQGHDLICSDYSAIEAVVLAALAGEQWRMDVFNSHGKIYEMSASKITGVPFEDFNKHRLETGGVLQPDGSIKGGQHHPLRKKVGKVAELASGYQGWIGAWKQFGADEFFNDDEIKHAILAWRDASPAIVEMWGGQTKNWYPHFYGLEGAAIQAVQHVGKVFEHRGITYQVKQDTLYCRLLSGRYLTYHKPRLTPSDRRKDTLSLSFEGWNTNPKAGPPGWIRMYTYGGKLTENVVQATARDILAHAIVNLEKAGYPIVLHVHDEIVSEIPQNQGSVAEFEEIMSKLPDWAASWPVSANGGWRGKRYGK